MDRDYGLRRVQSLPIISQGELKAELDNLRREVSELREAIAVFEGEHARWATRYTWRLAFYSNAAFAAFFLGHRVAGSIRQTYRISGLLGEFLVPQALRARGGFSATILSGVVAGLRPSAAFVVSLVLLLRRRGWLRTLGAVLSCSYCAYLATGGVYPWPSLVTLTLQLLYLAVRLLYRVPIAELVPRLLK
eukprot:EC716141.1.p1 GENE.EC716141.1~~EC716141.1.p1  ORF type:complete len:191 (+),score=11.41 EC716141.1:93-665(+)